MLEMGAVSSREKEKEYFTFITSEGQRLSRLIDNVLDFSRIGAGKRTYTLRPADLGKAVASTVRAFRQYVQPEGIEVVYEADPVIPRVLADEDAVSQALLNLLDNAVKFSPGEKGVRVELRRRLGEVLIRVSDRGIGIAPGDLEKIFFLFYRVDEGRKVARKGAGIGLSIVKHIAEAHGGRVEMESDLGGGSVFAIVIPVPVEPAE
jgi:two-component system phosphate regulon sensor histidine kinase PhoR